MSPDDHYQDLKRIIAALGGKARRITVIMPMLYEGRQHRRNRKGINGLRNGASGIGFNGC